MKYHKISFPGLLRCALLLPAQEQQRIPQGGEPPAETPQNQHAPAAATHDTSQAQRHAFAQNPYMRVYVAEGLYDAATPYFAVEYTLNHMGLTSGEHKNISRSRFAVGHMVYIDDASMKKLKGDVDAFYEGSSTQ
jgi:carboxypeptidase C (cathepsin A)